MSPLYDLLLNQFLVFVLVLTRISGLVMTAPVFGTRSAPMRVRSLLALGLAMVVTPMYGDAAVPFPGNIINMLVLIGREAVLGLALGLAVMILFAGIQLTGQTISQLAGISLADVFDPGFDSNVSVFSQFLDLVAVAVFVCIGGHRQVLGALLDTFQWMPPGHGTFSPDLVAALTDVTTQSFATGIRASAPVMVSLLLAVLITGLISRTLPQLNIMAIGFNVNVLVMLFTLTLSLGAAVWVFQEEVSTALDTVRAALLRTNG